MVQRGLTFGFALLLLSSCALTTTRPVQEMSLTASAIRAAKEVQADVAAPVLYRESKEWFFRARQQYRLKNFAEAKEYAKKARKLAERAEFKAIVRGQNRGALPPDPLGDPQEAPPPEATLPPPPPEEARPDDGIFVEAYEKRLEEQATSETQTQEESSPSSPDQTSNDSESVVR